VINTVINGAAAKSVEVGAIAGAAATQNPVLAGLLKAAEGARTLDLLHGKSRRGPVDHDRIMICPDVADLS
jgi:hypothetical protein